MLELALRCAGLGWRLFPIFEPRAPGVCSCARGAGCGRDTGKHPRSPHGHLDATANETTIRAWWTRWPSANVGLATGNGILVVDVDGPEGERTLAMLPELPSTVEQSTGRGRHALYRVEGPASTSKGRLGPSIDTRGDGGYIVLAPSLHASGRRYEWVRSPLDHPIAAAPQWLLDALARVAPCAPSAGANALSPAEGTQARAPSGSDPTDSGADWRTALSMIRRSATDAEVASALRSGGSYGRKRSEQSAERYIAHTIRKARALVASTSAPERRANAIRARITKVYDEDKPATPGLLRLRILKLSLEGPSGERLLDVGRAKVVCPTAGREQEGQRFRELLGDGFDPCAPKAALERVLLGLVVDASVEGGNVKFLWRAR